MRYPMLVSAVLLAAAFSAGAARAGDIPQLSGATFAKSAAACAGNTSENIEDSLVVEARGIFGYEFGCTFLDAYGISYDGETHQFVAPAQCSDDSGVFRPDAFSLVFNDEGRQLMLQSQNEYIEQADFVSGDYVRCD